MKLKYANNRTSSRVKVLDALRFRKEKDANKRTSSRGNFLVTLLWPRCSSLSGVLLNLLGLVEHWLPEATWGLTVLWASRFSATCNGCSFLSGVVLNLLGGAQLLSGLQTFGRRVFQLLAMAAAPSAECC